MPILKNPRRERFCSLYVLGETAGNAAASYTAAGYHATPPNVRKNAEELLKTPAVSARVAELQADLACIVATATGLTVEKLAITKENVLTEMANIGFSNVFDYVRHDEHGNLVVDLARVSRDQAAGLIAVRFVDRVNAKGERTREVSIRLGDKHGALVSLGKHLGLFVAQENAAPAVDPAAEAEMERRIAIAIREIAEERMARAAVSFVQAPPPPAEMN